MTLKLLCVSSLLYKVECAMTRTGKSDDIFGQYDELVFNEIYTLFWHFLFPKFNFSYVYQDINIKMNNCLKSIFENLITF